ncbi:DUF6527 family protein [Rhodococcus sp. NPDC058521]|uniref:DUF6527 family protein n=1 Tax=Rhodococcus sp. NPDC058521 TaxID=3346536 RepID=UPI0036519D14
MSTRNLDAPTYRLDSRPPRISSRGCRREVVTPLSSRQWVLTFDGTASSRPSIGSWSMPGQPCRLLCPAGDSVHT